jgi:hypothetical protein
MTWFGWARKPDGQWTLVGACPGDKFRVRGMLLHYLADRPGYVGALVPKGVDPDSPRAEVVKYQHRIVRTAER